ncbi:GHKL domain-containing protein [Vagococcus sp. JNUCC 83]
MAIGTVVMTYQFFDRLLLFFLLYLLTVKSQKDNQVFLSAIIVLSSFLIPIGLSYITAKIVRLFLNFDWNIDLGLLVSEIFLYFLIYVVSVSVRDKIVPFIQSRKKEKVIAVSLLAAYAGYESYEIYKYYFGTDVPVLVSIIIIIAFAVLIYNSTQSISSSQELKIEVEKQKLEVKYMNEYAKQIAKQYNEIKKFKHDYVNILSSLDYFIQSNDMEKLALYYKDVIRPTQELLDKNSFNFKELSNIKSDELKSILAIKMLLAKDQDVFVQMEVPDVIPDNLPVDFVVLIRMIGILFDNSIEEVVHIPDGKIEVGLFAVGDDYLFVIKNSIRNNTPALHQLEIEGFSTKGDDRGLGLSNLRELSKRQKYLMLETVMTDKFFIQKIMIKSGGE